MRGTESGLTTRQFEREHADLAVEFSVAFELRNQVCFSPTSHAIDAHTLRGRAVDISSGGLGLILNGLVPRMCDGTVRIFDPSPCGETADGTPIHEVIFEHEVKVRRVAMHDRTPTYAIGVAFTDPEPHIEERINRLLDHIQDRAGAAEKGADADA
jgi:c-di-GMP-binding flagellar brake protein YcgR